MNRITNKKAAVLSARLLLILNSLTIQLCWQGGGFGRLHRANQNALQSHNVGAYPSVFKKATVTRPFALAIGDFVDFVIAFKGYFKLLKLDSLWFVGVKDCFFNLANHTRVH